MYLTCWTCVSHILWTGGGTQEKEVQLGRLKTPDGVRPSTSGTAEAGEREGGEGALTEEEVMDALNSDIVQRSESTC